ncbi:hypothetical protein FEK35_30695 [Nocardia cyriacigeorgica]|uniref:Uncharacterized protein n=1 Tax=Nocardia cyriacigeorgica TaxID=135487 RepID=A0A5R8P4I5_9NOCA|nr:hypothetical protein [Nocardia cyriacigeorgica]TLF92309.1 hypothetical protein FEK35_30695 [Nocardia cyriacigeorgica]
MVEQTRIELTSPEAIAMIADYAAFQFASKWCLRNREDFVLAVRTLTADFVTSATTLAPYPESMTLRLRWTAHGRSRSTCGTTSTYTAAAAISAV